MWTAYRLLGLDLPTTACTNLTMRLLHGHFAVHDSDHAGNVEPDNKQRSQLAFTAMYDKAPIAWGSKATHVRFDEASHGSEPASGKPYVFGAPQCHDKCTNLHPDVSSATAEIYAASIALNECLYLSYMADEMGQPMTLPINIQVDNSTAIAFSKDRIVQG